MGTIKNLQEASSGAYFEHNLFVDENGFREDNIQIQLLKDPFSILWNVNTCFQSTYSPKNTILRLLMRLALHGEIVKVGLHSESEHLSYV